MHHRSSNHSTPVGTWAALIQPRALILSCSNQDSICSVCRFLPGGICNFLRDHAQLWHFLLQAASAQQPHVAACPLRSLTGAAPHARMASSTAMRPMWRSLAPLSRCGLSAACSPRMASSICRAAATEEAPAKEETFEYQAEVGLVLAGVTDLCNPHHCPRAQIQECSHGQHASQGWPVLN